MIFYFSININHIRGLFPVPLLFFLIILFFPFVSKAQSSVSGASAVAVSPAPLSENVQAIEYHLHRLELETALKRIENEKNPLLKAFYSHHHLFLTAFVKQEKAYFQSFLKQSVVLQDQITKFDTHRYYHFMQAEIYFERTLIKVLDQNLVSALNDLRKCYTHAQSLKKSKATASLSDRFSGIFLIAFSAVPKKYKWALDLFGLEGNLQQGVTELTGAYKEGELLRAQNGVVLYFVIRNLLADADKAKAHIQTLYQADPTNVLYVYLYAHNCIDRRDNNAALGIMQKYVTAHQAVHFPFMYNMLGRSYLFKLDYKTAIQYFDLFHQHFRGVIYRTDAYYRKGICYALTGDRDNAQICLKKATQTTDVVFDEDKFAQKESGKYVVRYFTDHDIILLKSRFLLDGGYHAQGKNLLDHFLKNTPQITSDEKTEVYYRLARMYDSDKNFSEAKVYYGLTFLQQPTQRLWMKVYAMLYYAVILEKNNQYRESQNYFKQALQFDNYDYQPGLEQKAKAGLQRIKPFLKR